MEAIVKRLMETHKLNESARTIDKLTDEEIAALPDTFLCVTRKPGASNSIPVFKPVSKDKFMSNPDKCFMIDSYWGYARAHEIYIATREDLEDYKKSELESIEKTINNYKKYLIWR